MATSGCRIIAHDSYAIVIKVARGALAALQDLLAALRGGRLGGAGLDTFPVEPVDSELLTDIPNLLVSRIP